MNPLLEVAQLSCTRQDTLLFTDLSLRVSAGELILIEGLNGSGKSTLLRLLSGLLTPQTGTIFWEGIPIQGCREHYQSNLHYVGHVNGIKWELTVLENIQLMSQLFSQPLGDIATVLSALQLQHRAHTLAHHLSAGEKRRLALMRLLLFPKKLWLLDEPLTALDVNIQSFFMEQLQMHLNHEGLAIISSHHPIPLATSTHTIRLSAC